MIEIQLIYKDEEHDSPFFIDDKDLNRVKKLIQDFINEAKEDNYSPHCMLIWGEYKMLDYCFDEVVEYLEQNNIKTYNHDKVIIAL